MIKNAITLTFGFFFLLTGLAPPSAGSGAAYAQGNQVELRGTIIDEANAYIAAAPLTCDDGKGNKYTTTADERGRYRFVVSPGVYTLTVGVEGFAKFVQQIDLTSKRSVSFDVKLKVVLNEQVEVKDNSAGISPEPDKNLSAITISEKDLEALPDDPDELLQTLKQMAGAAGGGDDAAIYVGGFRERGQLPPKEAILRISINSNPFSAEYSEPGSARIEIITKPGSDTFHGGFRFNFNDESLNARNAFAPFRAPVQVRNYGGNFNGPIIRNRWGFFADFERRATDENDVINATVLNPVTFQPEPFQSTALTPQRLTTFNIRSDYLATKRHTIGVQYRYSKNEADNQGLGGGFDLPSRAYNRIFREDTLRFSLTTIANEHLVNEMRAQLSHRKTDSQAIAAATAIQVLDSFSAGGNQSQLFVDNSNRNLDLTDNLTYTHKTHTFKAGFRAEGLGFQNTNRSNFLGTFTFGSDVVRDAFGLPVLGSDGQPTPISALTLFGNVIQGVPGYRPSQFSINKGDPFVGFNQWQMGAFALDDWRVSPRLTLSYGLRYEFQTHLQDKLNFAPRFSLAWVPDKNKKSTIRAGGGVFFTGLDSGITSDTIRSDPARQQQFVITLPGFFPNIPDNLSGAITRLPTIRVKQDSLTDPYQIVSSVSYERQLPLKLLGSVGYTFTRGVHLLRARNINAPRLSQDGAVVPFPDEGPILEFESSGLSIRHEMRVNVRRNISRNLTLFGNYTLASTRSDTDGAYTSPADPYDLSTEFGRSSSDVRNQFFVGGSFALPAGFRINPYIFANSGRPFNITTGRDNNRDTQFSDRPSLANLGEPGAIVTRFGVFNPDPRPGDSIIERNFGQGPGSVTVNVSVAKTFGFGPPPNNLQNRAAAGQDQNGQQGQNQRGANRGRNTQGGNPGAGSGLPAGGFGGGGPVMMRGGSGGGGMGGGGMGGGGFFGGDARHKYNLTLAVEANNVFNHTNLAGFSGVLSSPFFGLANRANQPRRITASLRFNF